MHKNRIQLTVLLTLFAILSACATPATHEGMTVSQETAFSYTADRPLSGRVAVGEVTGGKKTNPMWTSEIDDEQFSTALTNSLRSARLLDEDGDSDFLLNATLEEVDQPIFGLTYTVKSTVHYTLENVDANSTLIDQRIVADGVANTSDALSGAKRLRLANERSAKENIKQIVEMLYNHDLP